MISKPGPSTQRARRRAWERELRAAKEKAFYERCDEFGILYCEGCGEVPMMSPKDAAAHHIKLRSQGGSNDPSNLKLCALWGCGCHAADHHRHEIYY
jgi:hypothetical protein